MINYDRQYLLSGLVQLSKSINMHSRGEHIKNVIIISLKER
jgi:hypothetical protein